MRLNNSDEPAAPLGPLPQRDTASEQEGQLTQEPLVTERLVWKIPPPDRYQVLLLNDDFTPMEFVVMILQDYFYKNQEVATQIMLKIHLEGKAVAGIFSKDIAMTKVKQVISKAREQGHPLQCLMEPLPNE